MCGDLFHLATLLELTQTDDDRWKNK